MWFDGVFVFLPFDLSPLCYCLQTQLERFTSMRMKKEKTGQISGQRHSSASNYEMSSQSGMLQDLSDENILELFEKMLVSEAIFFCLFFFKHIIKPCTTDLCYHHT